MNSHPFHKPTSTWWLLLPCFLPLSPSLSDSHFFFPSRLQWPLFFHQSKSRHSSSQGYWRVKLKEHILSFHVSSCDVTGSTAGTCWPHTQDQLSLQGHLPPCSQLFHTPGYHAACTQFQGLPLQVAITTDPTAIASYHLSTIGAELSWRQIEWVRSVAAKRP